VLVTEAVRDNAADGFDYSDAGPKRIKGFSAPVHAYRARRA
jgi:class 3 adenylate cyclase